MNVLIIGGGASGMLAALSASEDKSNTVTLLERQGRVGRKLAATGNGRCNITNTGTPEGHYHGEDPAFPLAILCQFDELKFFSSLGLLCTEQYGGRVYPHSDSANSVVDVLRFALDASGVNVITSAQVISARKKADQFAVTTDSNTYYADSLIIACGGRAGGKLGGTKDGYELLQSFGHSCTKLHCALVPVTTEGDYTRSLKGIRCEASLSLGNCRSAGELQFVENGISGPAAFDISRTAAFSFGEPVSIDLLPENADILPVLQSRRSSMPELEAGSLLTGILHNRLGLVIVKYCGIRPSAPLSSLSENDLENIAYACRHFTLTVKGVGDFDNAQITVGGIRTCEFQADTLQSRLVPGLYACGEVLDVDADCGGYNLRWAWASGYLAGKLK